MGGGLPAAIIQSDEGRLRPSTDTALSRSGRSSLCRHGDPNETGVRSMLQAYAKLAGILLLIPDKGALIEGHTDSTGSADYNLDLSQRRANAVRRFLQLEGIAETRMDATGFGMEQPVADNTSPAGRKKNRRVEIVISYGRGTQAAN